jgi:hypothetical protein
MEGIELRRGARRWMGNSTVSSALTKAHESE